MRAKNVKDYVAPVTVHVVAAIVMNARGSVFMRQLSIFKYFMGALRVCVPSCNHIR